MIPATSHGQGVASTTLEAFTTTLGPGSTHRTVRCSTSTVDNRTVLYIQYKHGVLWKYTGRNPIWLLIHRLLSNTSLQDGAQSSELRLRSTPSPGMCPIRYRIAPPHVLQYTVPRACTKASVSALRRPKKQAIYSPATIPLS